MLLFCFTNADAQSTLDFEGQGFGTQNFSENGINWSLNGWINIRGYGGIAYSGSNAALLGRNGDNIQSNHNITVASLWINIFDMSHDNTSFIIKCYNSLAQLVAQKNVSSSYSYQQVNFTDFTSITKIVFVYDGSPDVAVDYIAYTDVGVLPVELTSFTAQIAEKNVELKWRTATETNNYGFEIERAIDNGQLIPQTTRDAEQRAIENWSKIGFVEGNGTTNAPKSYSFTDKSSNGKISYRLKQIDRDGKFAYSQEVEVTIVTTPTVFALSQNYPNPFNPTTTIQYSIPVGTDANPFRLVTLKIYDALGREVATLVNEVKDAGTYSAQFDGARLSSGVYFARLSSPGKSQIRKLLLMK
jgi:hypothetical protein